MFLVCFFLELMVGIAWPIAQSFGVTEEDFDEAVNQVFGEFGCE